VIRSLLVLVLAAGLAVAQEFPTSPTPTTFDCTTGCGMLPRRWVECVAFVRVPEGVQGPRCRSYCQYQGMPPYDPGPPWESCRSFAPAGVACNATEYVYAPAPGRTRPRLVCDAGQADGLVP